ncbi:hypothetical protein F4776DRAFT_607506 [Hypoxylon sp. NC0597]|nr:hypothetical protein F4776DRAFT_607506 [Hypoxylon sp. NC0597]
MFASDSVRSRRQTICRFNICSYRPYCFGERSARDYFSYPKIRKATSTAPTRRAFQNSKHDAKKERGTAFFKRRPRIVVEQEDSGHLSTLDMHRWALVKKALPNIRRALRRSGIDVPPRGR